MTWKELAKAALLGTERSHLSAAFKEKLAAHGINMAAEETQILLESAAFFSQINKAAFVLPTYKNENLAIADSSDERVLSPKSAHHLDLMLNGSYEKALPEFIYHLEENGRQLSPKNLPDLLNKSLESNDFWEAIKPAIGKRGWWLVAQNPAWHSLEWIPSPDIYALGSQEERMAFLKFFREREPAKAVEILSASWEKENLRDKLAFLKLLKIGLSVGDESFLESILYDGRKEIREEAANLLAGITDSALVERMFLRARDLIVFENGNLTISLPDEPDETAIRDGIQIISKKYGGQKSGILQQLFAKISPGRWEGFLGTTPEEALKLFHNSEWSTNLIQALVEATILHQNQNWAKPLMEMWLYLGNGDKWDIHAMIALADLMATEVFQKITAAHLEKQTQFFTERSPVFQLLIHSKHPWNNHLAMLAIGRFQQWIKAAPSNFWDKLYYKTLLQEAAYKCPPDLFEKLKSGWGSASPAWGFWEKDVEQFLRILIFRKEMIGELKKG